MNTVKEHKKEVDENEATKITFYIPKLLSMASNNMEKIQEKIDESSSKVMCVNPQSVSSRDDKLEETRKASLESAHKDLDVMCRICYGGETKSENVLTPCLCSGSTRYVHEKCLLEWFSVKQSKTCELCLYQMQINCKGMKPLWKWKKPNYACDVVATLTILYTLVMIMFLGMVTWIASSQCLSVICIILYCLCCLAVGYFCYCCSYMSCMKPFWRGFMDVNRRWTVGSRNINFTDDRINETKI